MQTALTANTNRPAIARLWILLLSTLKTVISTQLDTENSPNSADYNSHNPRGQIFQHWTVDTTAKRERAIISWSSQKPMLTGGEAPEV